ncbi:hypothetical protein [Mycolicibacterium aichiense]|uniref:Uncharacterized protein n=1 Tax=Mycolicibacterium aichiense TaxID=1799 RepID=A0AAD1HPJ2_9MYCO|nr:hypothetical protein [Mycolicibacterium aichiense]MCV7021621.1 hypothetical protein [Mycolicibacterium aichiense]BBX08924.1 hypothetical protein MAIC_37270 [Mycolicibacterium aichiense]STZ82717.1 Uncharacterised protein [Mycolicibacterium aichiense]
MHGHDVTTESSGFAGDTGPLGVWTDRLDAFSAALDAIDADDPFDYCADAWEIWQGAAAADPPPQDDPAVLVVLGTLQALAHAMTSATLDYYRTADIRDRMTASAMHTSIKRCLGTLRRECGRWLHEGGPPADEINARTISIVASLQASGARPTVNTGIIFDKVCALTNCENKRYREAYGRLRTMVNRESLQHIIVASETLTDVVTGIVLDLQTTHGSTFDERINDERRRKIGSALAAVTAALHAHRQRSVASASKTFGHNSPQARAVDALFADLAESSFDYRWLTELYELIQHDDSTALRYQFTARRRGEPQVDVHLDRQRVAAHANHAAKRCLAPDELAVLSRDPSVLDMITGVLPKLQTLQGQIDDILYPNVADDVAAVTELIGRFGGEKGVDAVKSAPGSTHEPWTPPHLSPRVLAFVRTFNDRH